MKNFISKLFIISILLFSNFSLFADYKIKLDDNGNTELHNAVKELDVENVKSILERYKKKLSESEFKLFVDRRNIKDNGKTCLHYLAELAISAEGFVNPDSYKEVNEETSLEYPETDKLKKILEIIKLLIESSAEVFVWSSQKECPIDCFRVDNICSYSGSNEFEEIRELLAANYLFRKIILGYYGCTIS